MNGIMLNGYDQIQNRVVSLSVGGSLFCDRSREQDLSLFFLIVCIFEFKTFSFFLSHHMAPFPLLSSLTPVISIIKKLISSLYIYVYLCPYSPICFFLFFLFFFCSIKHLGKQNDQHIPAPIFMFMYTDNQLDCLDFPSRWKEKKKEKETC